MSLSYEMFSSAPGATCYQSFVGYGIPPKLQGPIPFELTEPLPSFYLARHDDGGRLLWFAKIVVESQDVRGRRSVEADAPRPGSGLVVEAVRNSDSFEPGQPIGYAKTKDQALYFLVEVVPAGVEGKRELLRRQVAFADFYTYGPSGRLRQRKLVKPDGGCTVWHYDDRGNVIEQFTAATGGISPAERETLRSDRNGRTDQQPPRPDAPAGRRDGGARP